MQHDGPVRNQIQAPSSVVMVRPHHFTPNPETAADNVFQLPRPEINAQTFEARALREVDDVARTLMEHGVGVHVFDDLGRNTPDSVFPNNWFSTHHGGRVVMYPMAAPSRRGERRVDVIEMLKRDYRVQEVIDYSGLEPDGLFLEGTGAMILDHVERVAYVGASQRASQVILERFCTHVGYEPMVFESRDPSGAPIYHTNVIMSIGTDFALLCTEVMTDARRRDEVVERLTASGRDVIDLSWRQVTEFAGNGMELTGSSGRIHACSARAAASYTDQQRARIEASARIVAIDVPTIELAGGSVRCMLAGIHLSRRCPPAARAGPRPGRQRLGGHHRGRRLRRDPTGRERRLIQSRTARSTRRAAVRAVRPSTSKRGLSSATSSNPSRPDPATVATTARTTSTPIPKPAGALTPGATDAGSASRSRLRWTRSTPLTNASTNAVAASTVESSSIRTRAPIPRAASNRARVLLAAEIPATP